MRRRVPERPAGDRQRGVHSTPIAPECPKTAGRHGRPLHVHDVPRVADQVPGEIAPGVVRKVLRRLQLLRDDLRLLLRARSRLVVRLERQEDDEPEQDREARGQHPEHTRGAVPVGEVAAFRRGPSDEQHHRDRHARDENDYERCPGKAHVA